MVWRDFWHVPAWLAIDRIRGVKGTTGKRAGAKMAQGRLADVWPASVPTDSELQRRKKVAVRNAQVAVAVLVAAGVIGAIAADFQASSPGYIVTLVVVAVAYAGWSLSGMREPIRRLLAEHPLEETAPAVTPRAVGYFAVQLALAGFVFMLSNRWQGGALAWLVLLPPVAHAVILLPRNGVIAVATLSVALLMASVAMQQGLARVPRAAVAFAFAVAFTWIFTSLAVSAERARGDVQKLADELAEANGKLRAYAVEAEELAAARERNRLAREIHDSLGHYLTIVNVQIEAARAMLSRDAGRSRDALDKAQSLTQEGLKEIRRSVAALRAPPLDNRPLATALHQIAEESRAAGLNVEVQVDGAIRDLPPASALTLYRAAQEGLTNVRKHAGAAGARVTLEFRDGQRTLLRVSDPGVGRPENGASTAGFGLLGLRERAQLLGGEVRTHSAPGAGFTLEVEVPG